MASEVEARSLSRPDLWKRIAETPLPGQSTPKSWFSAAHSLSFRERLEKTHGLTPNSARRLEAEYRRFLYLKALDRGRLTPSARVDQAWHQHIAASGLAWPTYCDQVLGGPVLHETGLSRTEASASYDRTLDLYRKEFGTEPPSDIWPSRRAMAFYRFGRGAGVSGGWLLFGSPVLLLLSDGLAQEAAWAGPLVAVVQPCLLAGFLLGLVLMAAGLVIGVPGDLPEVARCG